MPNHCHNDLWINGSPDDVAAALALIGADKPEPQFDFNAIIPYPAEFAERDNSAKRFHYSIQHTDPVAAESARADHIAKYGSDRDGFNSGGFEWCNDHWETKWGAYSVVRRDYEGVCITYQTAWSPAKKIIIELAKRFPTCSFSLEYFEQGMGYAGGFECPCDEDWCGEENQWFAGIVINEWHTDKYNGNRGG